ncbi:thylakoid lumenal 16.5 kDa protein, chloroplastic [Iris pallida]|uniref:Thylakoid lumenal 16.5 kDa protein, chloroplastic n=1 Tax=Iris pallida TaxID=29817 RepID=A0AAX6FIV4_IRIPA|nr:thylakoid lumenal 16.5 kDa protein, chloroplastic [Iris pallida]
MAMAMAFTLSSSPTIVSRVQLPPTIPAATTTSSSSGDSGSSVELVGRRRGLSACVMAALGLSLSGTGRAAILEADDDLELLDRVKKDRQKRLERQGLITSSNKETGYLQELVYKLSKVGQAIENNDFSAAADVLGPNTDWVKNVNAAFAKLSFSPEEKTEVDTFNSSLESLISSVGKSDIESSQVAFVSSASALEKWIVLTGLVGQLKGI